MQIYLFNLLKMKSKEKSPELIYSAMSHQL